MTNPANISTSKIKISSSVFTTYYIFVVEISHKNNITKKPIKMIGIIIISILFIPSKPNTEISLRSLFHPCVSKHKISLVSLDKPSTD